MNSDDVKECEAIAAKGDKSPEEVERLVNLGIRLGKLNSRDQVIAMEVVAERLYQDGAITVERKATLVSFLRELRQ